MKQLLLMIVILLSSATLFAQNKSIIYCQTGVKDSAKTTVVTFHIGSEDDNNIVILNVKMNDGSVKKYPTVFWSTLNYQDTWAIIINNETNQYIIKRITWSRGGL